MTEGMQELRALIREVIRDQLGDLRATETVETVDLSTDDDFAAFVARLLDLSEAEREEVRAGRKRFRLGPPREMTRSSGLDCAIGTAGAGGTAGAEGAARRPVRRVERGAVTERMVREAARAGERLVLGRGAVVTPLARDRARASGVEIERER
ncbi:MAG TPA: hypothetical protein VFB06_08755 [Streptosporangiaceae bacterium]|nr:hypothetical protein [Streptosporangiaceae bacterium]